MTRGIVKWAALCALFIGISALTFAGGSAENSQQPQAARQSTTGSTGTVATGASTAATTYPLTVTDSLGTTVTLAARPQTVISLSLFSDEVLFDLVGAGLFAGTSSLAADPIYSNVAERAAAVEPRVDFNVEQIISIYPDLVVAANWSEADKIDQLRTAGIVVYQINTPFTVAGIQAEIRALADLVDARPAAEAMIADMDARVASLQAAVGNIAADQRVTALDYNNWGTANGADTTWNEVLRLAGVVNAAAAFQAGDFGQVPMSKELLVELDPSVIFLPGYIWGDDNAADAFRDQVLNDPAFADLQAVTNRRAHAVPERLKGTYSHYLVAAAEYVARLAYPDRF